MNKGIFITGTDTDIGKTYVAALIVKKLAQGGYDPGYFKAAASGIQVDADGTVHSDPSYVREISGISASLEEMCPYTYVQAVSPHLACQSEGSPVDLAVVKNGFSKVCASHPYVVMEGSGGILCPIRQEQGNQIWLEDIIRVLGLSSVIVADAGLGTINHTVLTAFYMEQKKLPVRGVIFNHCHPGNAMEEDNISMIQKLTHLPVIARVKPGDEDLGISAQKLASYFSDLVIAEE
ncbi:MAG: dethiobiotin synthase [Blautia sp.]|jgi:dethiobiotin synthetase